MELTFSRAISIRLAKGTCVNRELGQSQYVLPTLRL